MSNTPCWKMTQWQPEIPPKDWEVLREQHREGGKVMRKSIAFTLTFTLLLLLGTSYAMSADYRIVVKTGGAKYAGSVHAEDEDGGIDGDRAQALGLGKVSPVDDTFRGELDVYLEALQSVGSQAEAHYQDSLSRLKARAADFAPMVELMYWASKSDDYFKRWALVHALGELEVAPAMRSLREIALSPVPSERAPGVLARVADREEETMIRLRAVSGLARHARRGDQEALVSLRDCLRAKDRAVRATAVYEYLEAEKHLGRNPERTKASLRRLLSKQDRWMLDLRAGNHDVEGQIPDAQDLTPQTTNRAGQEHVAPAPAE